MIILGIALLIIGFLLKIAIVWAIGILLLLVGLILALLGSLGRAVGGRRHYWQRFGKIRAGRQLRAGSAVRSVGRVDGERRGRAARTASEVRGRHDQWDSHRRPQR